MDSVFVYGALVLGLLSVSCLVIALQSGERIAGPPAYIAFGGLWLIFAGLLVGLSL